MANFVLVLPIILVIHLAAFWTISHADIYCYECDYIPGGPENMTDYACGDPYRRDSEHLLKLCTLNSYTGGPAGIHASKKPSGVYDFYDQTIGGRQQIPQINNPVNQETSSSSEGYALSHALGGGKKRREYVFPACIKEVGKYEYRQTITRRCGRTNSTDDKCVTTTDFNGHYVNQCTCIHKDGCNKSTPTISICNWPIIVIISMTITFNIFRL